MHELARAGLRFAGGELLRIEARDRVARGVLAQLATTMQLDLQPPPGGECLRLRSASAPSAGEAAHAILLGDLEGVAPLKRIAAAIGEAAQARGGLLLHAALVERGGQAVLLVGPGGRGKTTTSERIRPPWRALSDDAALVVRGPGGSLHAHPWPTWGRFLDGGDGGSWPVSEGRPLAGACFLIKTARVGARRIGRAHAAGLLVTSSVQAWDGLLRAEPPALEEQRRLRALCFERACELARDLPCFHLRLNLTDPFSHLLEEILEAR